MDKILSIIIPSYNSKPFLAKCIDSLLCECTDELDIIVVNDGSTDGCEKIAEEYIEKYPDSISLINKENGGHGSGINAGSHKAAGKYLKVLDADDWFLTENLPAFVNALKETDADVVLTPHHTINISNGEVKNWRCFPSQFGKKYTMDEVMSNWKDFDRSLTFHGITYRTDFYKSEGIRLSEKVFYEDHEYATFPCCKAKSILPLDLFIYEYRIGDVTQSVSAENQLKRIGHTETVLRRMTEESNKLDGAPAMYTAKKTHLLLLSYLVTSLLCDKNRKEGRKLADDMMSYMRTEYTEVYEMSRKHCKILRMLNRMHIGLNGYNKILGSKLYNKLRHNKSFD